MVVTCGMCRRETRPPPVKASFISYTTQRCTTLVLTECLIVVRLLPLSVKPDAYSCLEREYAIRHLPTLCCLSQLTLTIESKQIPALLLRIRSHDSCSSNGLFRPAYQLLEGRFVTMICNKTMVIMFQSAEYVAFDGLIVAIEVHGVCL